MLHDQDQYINLIIAILVVYVLCRFSSAIIFILLALLIYKLYLSRVENFNKDMTEVVDVGEPTYGLRGERMPTRPIFDCRFDCYTDCYNSNI